MPFTVGQAFRQGDVPSGSVVLADVASFQSVVKNRWPDGSVKFAILSGHVDTSANTWKTIGLSVGAAPAAQTPVSTTELKNSGASASIQFGAFGTASWSAGDWDSPTQNWVSGPEMSSWTYRKPLGSDPHLVAWLEVRTYKSGRVEMLPWIENGYLNVASPTSKSATASFTLNGTQRFSQALTLLNHQRAILASGTTLTHWAGADPQLIPRHNTAYLMASRVVPNYRGNSVNSSSLYSRLPTSYTPLGQASYRSNMGDPGYHPSIGLLPEWDVAYLTTSADPRAYRGVIISSYSAGRYGIHFRDEKTNRPLAFSSYPTLVMGDGSNVWNTGSSSTGSYTPTASGGLPPDYDSAHHPSMGFMAYLISGWNYHLEENQFLATTNYLVQNSPVRQSAGGVFESSAATGITRGAAWSLRSLAQAATLTPDSDALRTEFVNSINANVSYYHGRYVATANNPLGLVQPYDHYSPSDPWEGAVWMDDFFTASFGYLKDLQAYGSTVQTKLDQFLAWKYLSVVGRLGGTGSSEFSFRHAGQYTVPYAPSNSSNWQTGVGPWYTNWGAVARAAGVPTDGTSGSSIVDGYPELATGYVSNYMPALSYAVDHGAAGSAAAWSLLSSASNFASNLSTYNDDPVWGVKPRTR